MGTLASINRCLRRLHINIPVTSIERSLYLLFHPKAKKDLKLNKRFKDIHKGERCFIVGCGPSINVQDLTLLKNEYVFTVNQLSRRHDFEDINSNYHLWSDARFFDIDPNKPEDQEMFEVIKKSKNNNPDQCIFYTYALKGFVEDNGLKDENSFYFGESGLYKPNDYLKFDMSKQLPGFSTVIHYAICMAMYMGFKEIYLLGCDCTGFITTAQAKMKDWNKEILYGYNISNSEKKRLEKSNSKYSIENELSFYVDIFKTYSELYKKAKKKGIDIYNATEGGLLESIPRVDYNSLFGNQG